MSHGANKHMIILRKLLNDEKNVFVSLKIYRNLQWEVFISHYLIEKCSLLKDFPVSKITSITDVSAILKIINGSHLCIGNIEELYYDLGTHSKSLWMNETS